MVQQQGLALPSTPATPGNQNVTTPSIAGATAAPASGEAMETTTTNTTTSEQTTPVTPHATTTGTLKKDTFSDSI